MTLNIQKPNRIRHTYVQTINATPEVVFPLLCPVMEVEWVADWMPKLVVTECGVAERNCVFITPSEPHDAIWVISKHDPENFRLEMYKITPEHTVTRLEAALSAVDQDTTAAEISYEYTAIGEQGEQFLRDCTQEWYAQMMAAWEDAMNRYLARSTRPN